MLRQHEGLYESIIYQEDPLIPYNKSLQKHKELRENQEYINKGISLTINFLESFQQLYPNIPVRDIPFRVKSLSSIDNKIKNLILERLSKLALLNAETPEKFIYYIKSKNKQLEESNKEKINIDYNFPIKVRECVSLGVYPKVKLFHKLKKEHWKKVDEALKLVGLEQFSHRQISELSGGQFQRVLIARCLVQEAKYIFLDEPFVGIDSVSEEIIMNTLRKLKEKGHTILIVHHDLRKVHMYFDNVLLINKELIAYGETKETFTRENLTKAYGTDLFFLGGGTND